MLGVGYRNATGNHLIRLLHSFIINSHFYILPNFSLKILMFCSNELNVLIIFTCLIIEFKGKKVEDGRRRIFLEDNRREMAGSTRVSAVAAAYKRVGKLGQAAEEGARG